jgi:Integrase core domain
MASFNARLRDELLNGEIFYTLREDRRRELDYNTIKPHASLGLQTARTAGVHTDLRRLAG